MIDQDLKKIFTDRKIEISDEGFSERIARNLPGRKSLLPQIIMGSCITIGLAFVFAFQGFAPVFDQIYSLVTAINQSQIPSLSSIVTYLSILILTGIISYSVVQITEY